MQMPVLDERSRKLITDYMACINAHGNEAGVCPTSIELPIGYRIGYRYEDGPDGTLRCLTVSSQRRSMMPHPNSVVILMRAFGFTGSLSKRSVTFGTLECGRRSINVREALSVQ